MQYRNLVTSTFKYQRKAGTRIEKSPNFTGSCGLEERTLYPESREPGFSKNKSLNFPWLHILPMKIETNITLITGLQGRFSLILVHCYNEHI